MTGGEYKKKSKKGKIDERLEYIQNYLANNQEGRNEVIEKLENDFIPELNQLPLTNEGVKNREGIYKLISEARGKVRDPKEFEEKLGTIYGETKRLKNLEAKGGDSK